MITTIISYNCPQFLAAHENYLSKIYIGSLIFVENQWCVVFLAMVNNRIL